MTVQRFCTIQTFPKVLRKLQVITREENLTLKTSSWRINPWRVSIMFPTAWCEMLCLENHTNIFAWRDPKVLPRGYHQRFLTSRDVAAFLHSSSSSGTNQSSPAHQGSSQRSCLSTQPQLPQLIALEKHRRNLSACCVHQSWWCFSHSPALGVEFRDHPDSELCQSWQTCQFLFAI